MQHDKFMEVLKSISTEDILVLEAEMKGCKKKLESQKVVEHIGVY